MHTWVHEVGTTALSGRVCFDDGKTTFARRWVVVVDWDVKEAAGESRVRNNGGVAWTPLDARGIRTTLVHRSAPRQHIESFI